jgi:hypothetical protein
MLLTEPPTSCAALIFATRWPIRASSSASDKRRSPGPKLNRCKRVNIIVLTFWVLNILGHNQNEIRSNLLAFHIHNE